MADTATTSPTADHDGGPDIDIEREELADLRVALNRGRRRKFTVLGLQVGLLIVGLLAWEGLTGDARTDDFFLIETYYVSQPSDVFEALMRWWENGTLTRSIWTTAETTVVGLAWGILAGLIVGFALGVNAMLSSVLHPFISALYSIPRLALIPLFLLWFGIGGGARLAMVITVVFFLVFYNTYSGVRDVDQQLVDALKLMGASTLQIYRKVILQSAMMWIIAGLRIAVPYALVAAVTAEMLIADSGMGYLVIRSAGQFYTQGVFGGIVVMMGMAMVLSGLVTLFERRVLHWKPDVGGHAAL